VVARQRLYETAVEEVAAALGWCNQRLDGKVAAIASYRIDPSQQEIEER